MFRHSMLIWGQAKRWKKFEVARASRVAIAASSFVSIDSGLFDLAGMRVAGRNLCILRTYICEMFGASSRAPLCTHHVRLSTVCWVSAGEDHV